MTKLEHRGYIREYMRRWRSTHVGENYSAVKAWRKKLREKLGDTAFLAWQREQYRKYKDRILKKHKERLAKKDPILRKQERKEYWAKYKAENTEKIKAARRDYFSRNRERMLLHSRKKGAARRTRERAATIGDLTDIAKIYERAQWWKQWFSVEVDHVVPLSKGGTHEPKNLQIIYDFENRRKCSQLSYKPKVVFT